MILYTITCNIYYISDKPKIKLHKTQEKRPIYIHYTWSETGRKARALIRFQGYTHFINKRKYTWTTLHISSISKVLILWPGDMYNCTVAYIAIIHKSNNYRTIIYHTTASEQWLIKIVSTEDYWFILNITSSIYLKCEYW